MRRLIVSMNTTLDGYMAGPHCELDWHFNRWDEEMAITAAEQLSQADTILLGRVTYLAMANYWALKERNCNIPRSDIDFVDMMNSYKKLVFSKTLKTSAWCNSEISKASPERILPSLKQRKGKDIILYGSGKLAGTLTQFNLVDEYQLWIHPVILGKGKRLFKLEDHINKMQLYKTQVFCSGVVLLCYSIPHRSIEA